MMTDQGLTRSQSMPVLKTEEAILKKIQDQDGIIALMQTQIEFQSELIEKHDKIFKDLVNQVQDLSSKIKTLEESYSKSAESKEQEAARSALWNNSAASSEKKTSLADMVKETAEQTLGTESGFVFDETLGLYFDQSSGYYYDPVKQLYYNGHTKTFYSYDSTTNTYQVHSSSSVKRKKKSGGAKSKHKHTVHKKINAITEGESALDEHPLVEAAGSNPSTNRETSEIVEENSNNVIVNVLSPTKSISDMEEGEISTSAPTSAESSPGECSIKGSDRSEENSEEDSNPQTNYPPCIRAVILESSTSPVYKKGTLFVVPYTGGTIGSSGSYHAILLQCSSVEKNHAKIHYDQVQTIEGKEENDPIQDCGKYFITDLGSKNGTYLNKVRLSESGEISEPRELVHGSILQVGDVNLLIHIHPGDFTCGHCEPGLLLQKEPLYEYTSNTGETARRSEMKKLKKKYGLDQKFSNISATDSEPKYIDRAKSRRAKVGSDNPFAKTEVASTNTPIRESNKGFKMLQKMGWKGEGLGKGDNQGIKEPIDCEVKTDRLGFGVENSSQFPLTSSTKPKPRSSKEQKRLESLAKTMHRFKEAQSSSKDEEL